MSMRSVFGVSALLLVMPAVGMAQSTQQPPPDPSTRMTEQQPAPITLAGCLQREADYRRAMEAGRGGAVGTGAGLGNELILVNASRGPATSASAPNCASLPAGGEAYELTGVGERELVSLAGRYVEIVGTLKKADVASDAKPSGGIDPLRQDLRLPEVNVTSSREVMAAREDTVATRPAAPAPTLPAPDQPVVAEVQPAERQTLPRTASPAPLIGLLGLIAVSTAFAVRALGRS
jgi:hypothetical protein